MNKSIDFDRAKVLVAGDVMLDSYWQGQAGRISPEAPVPVVNINHSLQRLGGAANVAANIRSLGVNVTLVGICGDDEEGRTLSTLLSDKFINNQLVKYEDIATIRKLRVISQNQQLVRLDFESPYERLDWTPFQSAFLEYLPSVNLVILSDYGKGTLADPAWCIAQCRQYDIPVLVDPKGTDYIKYQGATCITPNLSEFQAVVGACPSQDILETKAVKLRDELALDALLITQGAKGMTLLNARQAPVHLPADAKDVFDVTGAGDTVIAVWGACYAAGLSMVEALNYANYAAGQVVAEVGTATVTREQLMLAPLTASPQWLSVSQLRTLMSAFGRRLLLQPIDTDELPVAEIVKLLQHTNNDGVVAFLYTDVDVKVADKRRDQVAATGLGHFHISLTLSEREALTTESTAIMVDDGY